MDILPITRVEQVELDLRQLTADVDKWLSYRREKDAARLQYATQLNAVAASLNKPIEALEKTLNVLRRDLPGAGAMLDVADVYEKARLIQMQIAWLGRVLHFFKSRFDQREDSRYAALLQAADEVVWSCYHQPMEQAKATIVDFAGGPTPLPFVESYYAPAAFPMELVPSDLRDSDVGSEFMRSYLNRLPIPVLRVTHSSAASPWWLALLAHEVGHHVQYDLLPGKALVSNYGSLLSNTIRAQKGGTPEDASYWAQWSCEIFADIFSVHMMGQWALWAIVEFELRQRDQMLARRGSYPSPLVRIALMVETARVLGLDAQEGLRGLNLDALAGEDAVAARDKGYVAAIVQASRDPLPGVNVALEGLSGFRLEDFQAGGTLEAWREAFQQTLDLPLNRTLPEARLITAAALAAWADLSMQSASTAGRQGKAPNEEDLAKEEVLAKRVTDVIARSAVKGKRAAAEQRQVDGTDLAAWLLAPERTPSDFGGVG